MILRFLFGETPPQRSAPIDSEWLQHTITPPPDPSHCGSCGVQGHSFTTCETPLCHRFRPVDDSGLCRCSWPESWHDDP
jgi:hypothetical protein